jgi:hypothetical protein
MHQCCINASSNLHQRSIMAASGCGPEAWIPCRWSRDQQVDISESSILRLSHHHRPGEISGDGLRRTGFSDLGFPPGHTLHYDVLVECKLEPASGSCLVSSLAEIYEKLGVFYLGREYDLEAGRPLEELLLYDSKDLVTHALCVGMTGSGKTGLCLSLLEEAAIDNVPSLVIDPKGDLSNLLLTFPDLAPADFEPWINADDARRAELSPGEFAAKQAALWRQGLSDWGIESQRIARLRETADLAIYTPGSRAGLPLSILASFAAPPEALRQDADLLLDRINTTATSLLGLLGIKADPVRSREHILLAMILKSAWNEGKDLDLGGLIQSVQQPPIRKVGVLDLESFYPESDRFELAMALNNLLAAPGFAAWIEGQRLDIDQLLYTDEGKPRVAILSVAHLSEAERMFFVSLLLNEVLGWMRSQGGTSSLRAILYMDEIFGYVPPVAQPPSKKPLLTLLKQARAYGLGLVLATQNPVDLDYKGLSNIGTWFLGRLQTEQDKARILDGLESATSDAPGSLDRARLENILSSLDKRVFLMHNVHEDRPAIFQTRWAMSYLRGPLGRDQIKQLMQPRKDALAKVAAQAAAQEAAAHEAAQSGGDMGASNPAASGGPFGDLERATTDAADDSGPQPGDPSSPTMAHSSQDTATSTSGPSTSGMASRMPVLPPEIPMGFSSQTQDASSGEILLRPHLLAVAQVHFVDTRRGLQAQEQVAWLVDLSEVNSNVDWDSAEEIEYDADQWVATPPAGPAHFDTLPASAAKARSYPIWKKSFSNQLYRHRRFELFRNRLLKETSTPGESRRDFLIRLTDRAHEERDVQVEKLRERYARRFQSMEERVRRAEQALGREREEASGAKFSTAISFGQTLLSALLGRKTFSSTNARRAGSSLRSASRASKQAGDVQRAEENLAEYKSQAEELEARFQAEVDEVADRYAVETLELETLPLKPRRTDIEVRVFQLVWVD